MRHGKVLPQYDLFTNQAILNVAFNSWVKNTMKLPYVAIQNYDVVHIVISTEEPSAYFCYTYFTWAKTTEHCLNIIYSESI